MIFRRFTEQFLVEAGIGRGMRVLDVGCGVGDVTLLVAELVGPTVWWSVWTGTRGPCSWRGSGRPARGT